MKEKDQIQANTFKEQEPVITKKNIGKSIHSVVDGSFLTRDKIIGLVPFLLFLVALAILYISNIYYAEKTIRQIDDSRRELKELQFEHITSKSGLMSKSKRSEVGKSLENEGLKESTVPPYRIYIQEEKSKGPVE